jgi:AcrR family transcriptional regulator
VEVVTVKVDHVNEADPRVKRTRKLIQDAFLALMAEKSFHAISVQDIAERATVNRATFYAHFLDKYALLDHVVGEMFRQTLHRRVPEAAPFSPSDLQLLIITVLEALAEFREHCKPSSRDLDPLIEARVQQELEAFLAGWLGRLPPAATEPRATRETAATVLSWAIFGAGITWSRGPRTTSADEMAREILALLTGGLGRAVALPSGSRREREEAPPCEVALPRS